jgi:hypothetical protein
VRESWRSEPEAQAARFLASVLILLQIHLAAGELSDLPFYLTAIVCSAAVGFLCAGVRLRVCAALCVLALGPWAARVVVLSAGRLFRLDQIAADSVLLAYDRNLLVALGPLYWSGMSAYFAALFRRFLRTEPLLNGAAIALFFVVMDERSFPLYQQPIFLAAVVVSVVFLEFAVLAGSVPSSARAVGRERLGAAASAATVCMLALFALLRPFEERAAAQGGGLIKPSLFRFDFSQYLRLESEISLAEDLVLIVRKDAEDQHTLIRRFVLSEYDRKRGFLRSETLDDPIHPTDLPEGESSFEAGSYKGTKTVGQEFFLVNFDASAFLALNQPIRVVPYKTWDAASFTSVYGVTSAVSEALPFELIDAGEGGAAAAREALGDGAYRRLTDYGGDPRIRELALEIIGGQAAYWDSVQAVYERLKFGEYRYSLKPGLAPDGDQLGLFLFDAKKGYCSYFAFSMTLLLRSLGIPARTAVGFFVDPETAAFDYFPVRSDMAHAWVEVFFPEYGWIEYDPTTEQLAEGEEFRFSSGVAPEQFERLMREILSNRERLEAKRSERIPGLARAVPRLVDAVGRFFRERWFVVAAAAWAALSVLLRAGLYLRARVSRDPRKAADALALHALRRLALGGRRRGRRESVGEYAARLDAVWQVGLQPVAEGRTKARFAPRYSREDLREQWSRYRAFSAAYAGRVTALRRFAGWCVPALLLAGASRRTAVSAAAVFLLLLPGDSPRAQEGEPATAYSDDDFAEIDAAIADERWERAVELLKAGKARFPDDSRYPMALGDLFADRKLYGLAWEEYRTAERVAENDPTLLHRLATTAGRLNKDEYSAAYLERVVTLRPDDRDAVGDLAWMYFKLHRLREGERFLLDAVSRLGSDPGFSMTLGTIYSDLYDYDNSKKWYLESIGEAKRTGARTFEAVALYNLSILETKFYRYAEAFKRTGQSLEAAERSSGHLARGELHLKRLEFAKTYADYERAYELDVSPLSKLNLADAYLAAGRLPEARSYAESTLVATDLSWMFNYGTNLKQYRRDIHDILSETYAGLANLEESYPRSGLLDWVAGTYRAAAYRVRAAGHRALFREYARKSAVSYGSSGQALDSLLNYYDAFSDYPKRARSYLREAQDLERTLVPASANLYELERGILERSPMRIEATVFSFDPVWQKDLTAKAYAALCALYPAGSAERRDSAERLFALNRGALRQRGIPLPVSVLLGGDDAGARGNRVLRTIRHSGFEPISRDAATRFVLDVRLSGGAAACTLSDSLRGTVVVSKTVPLPDGSGDAMSAFGRALADAVFSAY